MMWSDFGWQGGWGFLWMIAAIILMMAVCALLMRFRRGGHFMAGHACCGHPRGGARTAGAATPRPGGDSRHGMAPRPQR